MPSPTVAVVITYQARAEEAEAAAKALSDLIATVVHSNDADFDRFPGLSRRNPLEPPARAPRTGPGSSRSRASSGS